MRTEQPTKVEVVHVKLVCDFKSQILDFRGEFLSV